MGLTVTFTDTSTPAALITDWFWDFGDGFSDTAQNPVHTYALAGTYTVTLYVQDAYGAQDDHSEPVTVSAAVDPCGYIWDFTLNDGGFTVPAAGATPAGNFVGGIYLAGVGWRHTDLTFISGANTIRSRLVSISVPSLPFPVAPSTLMRFRITATVQRSGGAGIPSQPTFWANGASPIPFGTIVPAQPVSPAAAVQVVADVTPQGNGQNHTSLGITWESSLTTNLNVFVGTVTITKLEVFCS